MSFTRVSDGEVGFASQINELQIAIEGFEGAVSPGVYNLGSYVGIDDTARIAQAISDATAGGIIVFPTGSYSGDGATRHVIPEDVTVMAYGATLDGVLFSPRARSSIRGATFTGGGYSIWSGSATYDPDVTIRDCFFDASDFGIYDEGNNVALDSQHSGWKILNNVFDNCGYGILSARFRDWLISGNTFQDCVSGGIITFSGSHNRIIGNTIDGGVVGIGFVFHRAVVGYTSISRGNVISGNTVRGFSEEGISLDVRGNDGDLSGVIETDTVASTGTSGANFTVTMADAGWSTHPAAVYYGYYCTFLTGGLAGRSFQVADMPVNTGRMVFLAADMTSAEHALIQAGDYVSIGSPYIGNVISNNRIDAAGALSGHGTTNGIILFGNCFQTTISGNVVEHGNIEINSIEGIDKPTTTYADNYPRAMSLGNAVVGNTVTRGDILFDHYGAGSFENNPTFQSVGNVATGNVVLQGDIIADAHAVTASGNKAAYSTSNGGSFVDPPNTGVYNVLHYGAVGNGVTDDTAAFVAAIAAAVSGEVAIGEVYAPAGTYNIDEMLTVSYRHGFVLRGAGPGLTIIEQQTDNTGILRFVSDPNAHQITVRDLTLTWANQQDNTETGAIAIELWGDANAQPNFVSFENIIITMAHYGIKATNTADDTIPFMVTIRNIYFNLQAGPAIYVDSTSGKPGWLIDQIYILPGTSGAKPTGRALYFSGCDLASRNVVIDSWVDENIVYIDGHTVPALLENWHFEGGTHTQQAEHRDMIYVANGGVILRACRFQATINAAGINHYLIRGDAAGTIVVDGLNSTATLSAGSFYPVDLTSGPVAYVRNISGTWTDSPINPARTDSVAGILQVDNYTYLPTKAGTPDDNDVPVAKDGVSVLDTTNDLLYVRSGGVWVSTALT